MLAIIQARSSSKRFKNKVMKIVNGKPLISYVINSVKKSKKIKKIVIATSTNKSDDKLVNYLIKNKINFFRGSLSNVAERLLNVAKTYNAQYFVRISGDSPFIDYKVINKAINIKKKLPSKYDLITNIFPRTFPSGMSVEIIKTKSLEKKINKFSKFDLEHVTPYFYKNYKNFKIRNFKSEKKIMIKYSIDRPIDINRLNKHFKNFAYE
tara:strand:+ start:972 stop:1598 length:627 start_codon:yes stop_codon:yes gene_type:complete